MTYENFRQQYWFDETTDENLGKDGGLNLGVFKATDTAKKSNNTVIVKISQSNHSTPVNNEAKLILNTRIDSSYIANYLNWAENAGKIYTAMEFYSEKSLREKLESNAFSDNTAKEQFLKKVLEGIKALHSHTPHIVHKDLKPENILISTRNGIFIPHIADFGISAFAQKQTNNIYIVRNDACDARYASPEQIRGIENVSMNTDLYSFGVIALELFTGKRPCDMRGDDELQNVIAKVPYENWCQLIGNCLKNHLDRVQNVAACFNYLDNIKEDDDGVELGGDISGETGEDGDSGDDNPAKKPKWLKWLLILLTLLAITGGLYYLHANDKFPFNRGKKTEVVDETILPTSKTTEAENKTNGSEAARNTETTTAKDNDSKTNKTKEKLATKDNVNKPVDNVANRSNSRSNTETKSGLAQTSSSNIHTSTSEKIYSFGKYVGRLKNGIPEGQGTMYYNKRIQIAKHAKDAYYAENGYKFEGTWGNGDIEMGTLYDNNNKDIFIMAGKRPNPYDISND